METNTESVAQKVERQGYFGEARAWYSTLYHFPMAERSFFIIVILLGLLTSIWCADAFFTVLGNLTKRVPFVITSQDGMEELPTLKRLRTSAGEDRNEAILRYFLSNYVERREMYAYDNEIILRNFYNVRSQSTEAVFGDYRTWYDASNPSSPFNLYGNQTVRKVTVESVHLGAGTAQVGFTETLTGAVNGTRQWVAKIAYQYTPYQVRQDIEELSMTNFFGIALDVYKHPEKYYTNAAFEITPMTFVVTGYTANPYITE